MMLQGSPIDSDQAADDNNNSKAENNENLALRVLQLEKLVGVHVGQQENYPSTGVASRETAVADLGQLAKVNAGEGGSEARIYS